MFSIAGAIKMFSGKVDQFIKDGGGRITLSVVKIEEWCLKEKVPYKLLVTDNKEIVIVKR